jgi:hypothetical protein
MSIDVAIYRARRDDRGEIVVETQTVLSLDVLKAAIDSGWHTDHAAALAAVPAPEPSPAPEPAKKSPVKAKRK